MTPQIQAHIERIKRGVAAQTIVDRVVAWANPVLGRERLKARVELAAANQLGGYDGGRRERRATKRWRPSDGSADADTLLDLPDLRGRARDLERNVPIAASAVATKATNVVGGGLQLQSCVDATVLGLTEEQADAMEEQNEREFRLFARTCDLSRVQHWAELQFLAFRSEALSGDVFAVRRFRLDPGDAYGTKIQLLEADRVSNPFRRADADKISGGVEYDSDGVPIAYHVSDRHPGGLRTAGLNWSRLPAFNELGDRLVLHLFERLRPEQSRGVPYLAPVIEHIKQLGNYADAEVAAAVVSAMYTMIIESAAEEPTDAVDTPVGQKDASLNGDEVKLGAGATLSLLPGEKAQFANPARPNAQFDPFVQAFLRQIGAALELPVELLVKHFEASYSASRAALEMAWQFFDRQRGRFGRHFCDEIYSWFMDEGVSFGRLARPGYFQDPARRAAYLGALWHGPRKPSLQPYQEAQADAIDILETRTRTREDVCLERTGGRWETKHRQIVKEEKALVEIGVSLARGISAPVAPGDAGDNADPSSATPTKQGAAA
jgi:lambda family phage portal protein